MNEDRSAMESAFRSICNSDEFVTASLNIIENVKNDLESPIGDPQTPRL